MTCPNCHSIYRRILWLPWVVCTSCGRRYKLNSRPKCRKCAALDAGRKP